MQHKVPSQSGNSIEKWLYSRTLLQQANIHSKEDGITYYKELMLRILVKQIMYFHPNIINLPLGSQTGTEKKKIQIQLYKPVANQLVSRNLNNKMDKLIENEIIERIYKEYVAIQLAKNNKI